MGFRLLIKHILIIKLLLPKLPMPWLPTNFWGAECNIGGYLLTFGEQSVTLVQHRLPVTTTKQCKNKSLQSNVVEDIETLINYIHTDAIPIHVRSLSPALHIDSKR